MDQPQPPTPSQNKLSTKLQQTQEQVDEVTEIMKQNVQQVMERGTKISEMDERTKNLEECSKMFEKTGKKIEKKMWWKNMKMKVILVAVVALLLIIIIDIMDHPTASEQQYLLEKNKREVEAVTQILKNNVDKMLERETNISELNNRMQNLQGNSTSFRTGAGQIGRKYWWKNIKMMIIIGVVLSILLIIVIVVATH